ncbi:hypothetical protein [Dyadobacter jiangsuensis]|uniref:Uncharacterized protein n=1 Tax=Dyadobacter jiangsuensis TaxID=1591085 RepID=A0A2P8FP34_9BACT|nr:hypothetical protein [Dyadobacter jiangsuensis]PSL23486.1 hypothetical protein CLV60_11641 [Dyadobacter jiangsuensis]
MNTTDSIAFAALVTAIIALLISVPLAWIQISQYRRDRRGIIVEGRPKHEQKEWNSVILTNLSSTPILIKDWEMTWKRRKFFVWPVERRADDRGGPYDWPITIPPHDRYELELAEVYHFNWNPKSYKGKLYIDLYIAGKSRRVRRLVHKPSRPKK